MRRAVATLAAGLVASLVAASTLPALGHAGLRATIVLSPLIVALFATLRRELGAAAAAGVERLLGAAWLVVALHSPRLGLPGVERAIFAAFVLLVAWRVAALLPALARRLARGRTRSLAGLALAAGLALLPWIDAVASPDGDEPYFLLLAESLARDGDFDLRNQYAEEAWRRFGERPISPQPGDPVGADGERYSRHDSLLVVLLAPFWVAGGTFGARLVVLLAWALLTERLYRVARAFGVGGRGALRGALTAAFSAPLILYAHAIWVEVPAALAAAVVIERLAAARGSVPAPSRSGLVGLGVALSALPLLKLRLLLVALPLSLLALGRRALPRRVGRIAAAGVALAGAAVLWRNSQLVGRALRVADWRTMLATDLDPATFALRAGGLLFDVAFGLCAAGPIWLLALPGVASLAWRRRDMLWMLLAFAPYLLLVVSVPEWYGAWSPPFRFGIVLLPLLAAGLAAQLDRSPSRGESLLREGLGWTSGLVALLLVVEPGWATNFADGRSRLVDLAAWPFAADLARFVPSMVRPRTATWLVPLLALLLLAVGVRGRRRRSAAVAAVGAALTLALLSGWIVAAHRLPTRVVQVEDPWVRQVGGTLEPELYRPSRVLFTGAWRLSAGASASFRPIAGSERVELELHFRAAPTGRWATLELWRDGVRLAEWSADPRAGWTAERSPTLEWPREAELELRAACPVAGACGAVDIDRVEMRWRR